MLRAALHEIEKLATTSRDLAKMNQQLEEARLQAVSDQTRAAKRLMLMSSQLEYTEQRLYKLTKEVDDGQRDSDLLRIERIKREALQEREDANRLTIEALQDELQEVQRSERTLQQKLTTVQTKYEALAKRYEMMKRQQQEQELARESKEALAWLKETTDRLCSPPQGSLAHQLQEKSSSQGSGPINYSPGSSPTYSSSFMDPPLAAQNQLISLIKELATTNSTLRSELGEYRDLLQDARNEVLMLRAQVEDFEHSHAMGGCCGGDDLASSMRTSKSVWSGLDPSYPGLDAVSHIGTLGTSVPGSPPPYMTTAMAPSQHHHHHIHLPGVRGNVFGELERLYSQQHHEQQHKHREKSKKSHRKTSRASDPSAQPKSPRRRHHSGSPVDTATSGVQTVSTSTSTSELRRGGGTPTLGHKRLSQTSNSAKVTRNSLDESNSLSPSSHRSRKSLYTDVDMDMLDSGTERDDRLDDEDSKHVTELDDDAELLISDSGSSSDDQGTSFITAFAEGHSRRSSRLAPKVVRPPTTLGDELAAFGGLNPPMSRSSSPDDEAGVEELATALSPSHEPSVQDEQQQKEPDFSPHTPIKQAFDEGVILSPKEAGGDGDQGDEKDEDEQERLKLNRTSSVSLLSHGLETAKRMSTQSLRSNFTSSGAPPQQQQQQADARDDTSTPVPTATSTTAAMSDFDAGIEPNIGPLDLDLTGKRMSEYDMIRLESAVSALDRRSPKYPPFSLHDKSASDQDFMSLRQRRRLSEPWQTANFGKASNSYRPRQGRPGSIYSLRRSHRHSHQYSPHLYSSSVMGISGSHIHGIMGGVAGGGGKSQSFIPDASRYMNPELAEQRVAEQRKRMMEAWRVGVVAAAVTQQQSVHTIAAFDQKKVDLETMSIRSKVSRRSKSSRRYGKGKDRVASGMDHLDISERDLELQMYGNGHGRSSLEQPRGAVSLEELSTTTTNDQSTLVTNPTAATTSITPAEKMAEGESNATSKGLGILDLQTADGGSADNATTAGHDGLSTPPQQKQLQPPPLTINTNVHASPVTSQASKTPKAPRKRRSFNPRLQTPKSAKSPIMRSPYIPRLSRAERQFPSETSGISEFSTRHLGHHHGPYQLLHTLAAELLERLVRSDTRELNRRLQRTFDIHALSQMSNSVIENVLTDVNNLGERFRWVEAQVADPEDELLRTAAADTVSLRRSAIAQHALRSGDEGSGTSARVSSASEASESEGSDDDESYVGSDYDEDDDALSDEMDWNFSVEEFFPLAHLVQEMLSEIGKLRMTINELQLSYVQKIEQDRLRAEKDFQDELENDDEEAAEYGAFASSASKEGRLRRLGDIAEEGPSDPLAGFRTLLSKKRERPKILESASTGVSGFFSKVFGGGNNNGGNSSANATSDVGGNNIGTTSAAALLAAAASSNTGGSKPESTNPTPVDARTLAQRKPTGVTTETSRVFAETAWISSPRRTLTAQTVSSSNSTSMVAATATAEVSSSSSSNSLAPTAKQQQDPNSSAAKSVTAVLYRSTTGSKLSATESLSSIAAASPARRLTGSTVGTSNSGAQESIASSTNNGVVVGNSSGGIAETPVSSFPIHISPGTNHKGLTSTLTALTNISPVLIGFDAEGPSMRADAQLARSLPSIRSMNMDLGGRAQSFASSSPPPESLSFGKVTATATATAFAQGERVKEQESEDEESGREDNALSVPSSSIYSNPNKSTSVLITTSASGRVKAQRQRSLLASPARLRSMAAVSVVTHQDLFEEHWASLSTPASPRLTKAPGVFEAAHSGSGESKAATDDTKPVAASSNLAATAAAMAAATANLDNQVHSNRNQSSLAEATTTIAVSPSSSSSITGTDGGVASPGPASTATSILASSLAVTISQDNGNGTIASRAHPIPSARSSTSIHALSVASTPSSTAAPSWIESRRSSSNMASHLVGSGYGDAGSIASGVGSFGSGTGGNTNGNVGISGGQSQRTTEAGPPSDAAASLRLHQQQHQQHQQQQQQQQQQPFALIKSELGALLGNAGGGAAAATTGLGHGNGDGGTQSANFVAHKGKSVVSSLASNNNGNSAIDSVEILDSDPETVQHVVRRKESGDSYEQQIISASKTVTFGQGEAIVEQPQRQPHVFSPSEQLLARRKNIMSMVTTSSVDISSSLSSSVATGVSAATPTTTVSNNNSNSFAGSLLSSSASMAPPLSQKPGSTSTAVAYVVATPEQPVVLEDPHSETGLTEESVLGVMVTGGSGSGGGSGGLGGGGRKRALFDRELIRASQRRILTNIATTGSLHPTLDPRTATVTPKSATAAVKSLIVRTPTQSQSKAPAPNETASGSGGTSSSKTIIPPPRHRHQRSLSVDSLQSNEPLQEKEVMDFWRVGAGVSRDLWGAFKKKLESSMPDSQAKAAAATGTDGSADKDKVSDADAARSQ
ncbi:hypothetical protein BGW41_005325 [Actinomortierella wolfii]|nr:hypothetical protein BGW41_005325 [Actinomortierella wolfii]